MSGRGRADAQTIAIEGTPVSWQHHQHNIAGRPRRCIPAPSLIYWFQGGPGGLDKSTRTGFWTRANSRQLGCTRVHLDSDANETCKAAGFGLCGGNHSHAQTGSSRGHSQRLRFAFFFLGRFHQRAVVGCRWRIILGTLLLI